MLKRKNKRKEIFMKKISKKSNKIIKKETKRKKDN